MKRIILAALMTSFAISPATAQSLKARQWRSSIGSDRSRSMNLRNRWSWIARPLAAAIRLLERDRLLTIGEGEDGRTRSLQLTATGEARLKAATAKWREAQKNFESTFGAQDAAQLRSVLERVISIP